MVGTRDITATFKSTIESPQMAIALFVKLAFDGGDVNVWSGLGEITFLSETYVGVGILGGVSDIEETQEIRAAGVSFSLSGIPSELIAIALAEQYQGRPVTAWFALMDPDTFAVLASTDPLEIFSGRMDVMEIQEEGDRAVIVVRAESDLIDLQRPRLRRYTPEDQKIDYPDDKGLDMVASIQDSEVTWGAG